MAGVGYSQTQGVLFNASILQDNFLGSGKRIGLGFNNSKVTTSYNFSYLNPYSDIDGVSRGFNVFYRKTDAGLANLSRYATDVIGAGLSYGIPISEYNSIRLGFDVDRTLLKTTDYSAKEVFDFINTNGNQYNSYRISLSWARDTRNNIVLPNEGMLQSFGADVNLPFSDLTFYKVNFRQQWYYPIIKNFVLALKGEVAYGKGYGKTHALPFFENYTAGGPRTVRGFKENTLGPLDSNGLPLGGNLRVVGNAELILPPLFKSARSFRFAGFFDIGNVYSEAEKFAGSSLRYSTGISAMWLSPIGALSFSVAKPLNTKSTDQTQAFQFSIGTTF
jgi:outer membrane protein insertion porin family